MKVRSPQFGHYQIIEDLRAHYAVGNFVHKINDQSV